MDYRLNYPYCYGTLERTYGEENPFCRIKKLRVGVATGNFSPIIFTQNIKDTAKTIGLDIDIIKTLVEGLSKRFYDLSGCGINSYLYLLMNSSTFDGVNFRCPPRVLKHVNLPESAQRLIVDSSAYNNFDSSRGE